MRSPYILLVTVEQGGTMFVHEWMSKILGEGLPLEETHIALPHHAFLFAHAYDERMAEVMAYDGPIWTTDRPRELVEASWRERGKPLAELNRQWANLERVKAEKKPLVLSLDELNKSGGDYIREMAAKST